MGIPVNSCDHLNLPSVATYPPVGARCGTRWCVFQGRKNARSRHQRLFEENIRKTKMGKVEGLRILKMRVRELFMHGEGISTPRAHHKGRQPLIECANHEFNFIYFPFYLYFPFLYFVPFLAFYLFYFLGVDKGVSLAPTFSSIAMRKSNLRTSLRTERWLNCFFYLF